MSDQPYKALVPDEAKRFFPKYEAGGGEGMREHHAGAWVRHRDFLREKERADSAEQKLEEARGALHVLASTIGRRRLHAQRVEDTDSLPDLDEAAGAVGQLRATLTPDLESEEGKGVKPAIEEDRVQRVMERFRPADAAWNMGGGHTQAVNWPEVIGLILHYGGIALDCGCPRAAFGEHLSDCRHSDLHEYLERAEAASEGSGAASKCLTCGDKRKVLQAGTGKPTRMIPCPDCTPPDPGTTSKEGRTDTPSQADTPSVADQSSEGPRCGGSGRIYPLGAAPDYPCPGCVDCGCEAHGRKDCEECYVDVLAPFIDQPYTGPPSGTEGEEGHECEIPVADRLKELGDLRGRHASLQAAYAAAETLNRAATSTAEEAEQERDSRLTKESVVEKAEAVLSALPTHTRPHDSIGNGSVTTVDLIDAMNALKQTFGDDHSSKGGDRS